MQVASMRVLQPTLQVTLAMFLTMLLTFIRPINFSLACLASVFALVLHILLVQNFHVGTQILSAASLLGSVWSGIAAAGIVVTICMQIPSTAGHIALLVLLSSAGLALGSLVRVSARQFPALFLKGTNLLLVFGMSVVLSFWAPTVQILWSSYLAHMLLAFTAAGLASVVSGLLVLPSLATAEALSNVITALNRAGQTGTMCVSILLAPLHTLGPSKPGDAMSSSAAQQQHQSRNSSPSGDGAGSAAMQPPAAKQGSSSSSPSRQPAVHMHEPSQPDVLQRDQHSRLQLQQQASLLLEEPTSPASMSSFVQQATQPGQWGIRSFIAANSAAQQELQLTRQVGSSDSRNAADVPHTEPSSAAGVNTPGASTPRGIPAAASAAALKTAAAAPAVPAAAVSAGSEVDAEDWGNDHYEGDQPDELASADANVQLSAVMGSNLFTIRPGKTPAVTAGAPSSGSSGSGGGSGSGSSHSSSSSSSNGTEADVSHGSYLQPQALQLPSSAAPLTGFSGVQGGSSSGLSLQPQGLHHPLLQHQPAAANRQVQPPVHSSSAFATGTFPAVPLAAPAVQHPASNITGALARQTPHSNGSLSSSIHHLSGSHHHHHLGRQEHQTKHQHQHQKQHQQKVLRPPGGPRVPPELQRHPLIRLQRGVDQIRPLLQATKQLQAAVAVEQASWVGLLVRYRAAAVVDAGAWQQLVEALEALVHRVAALESMLEGGHDYSSLAQLSSYQSLASTCGAVFAQAAALCAVLSTHLQAKLQGLQQQGDLVYAVQALAGALSGSCRGSSGAFHKASAGVAAAAPVQHGSSSAGWGPSDSIQGSKAALGCYSSVAVSMDHNAPMISSSTTANSPPTAAAPTALYGPSAAASSACSPPANFLLPHSALCSSSCFNWGLAKQHLVRVLEFETQQYYTALVQAARDRPFKLDPARSMTALMALCMLSMGVIDACQQLQTAAHRVLGCAGSGSSGAVLDRQEETGMATQQQQSQPPLLQQPQQQQGSKAATPAAVPVRLEGVLPLRAAPATVPAADTSSSGDLFLLQQQQQLLVVSTGATSASHSPSSKNRTADSSSNNSSNNSSARDSSSSSSRWRQSPTVMLLRVFLMEDVAQRIWNALAHQLPAACSSWPAFKAQLQDRRFQAGFKAWLGATVALVVMAAAYTRLGFLGRQAPSIFMFGFMSLIFTMRERVESSMEMVIFRVGATVVGACLGHALMFHPATAYDPWILGAANIFFCLLLTPASLGQFRLVVVLGLLTFASVTLCQYVGCCGAVGSLTYLVGRILATGGGSLFAMLLNRLLWPWRRNKWAMEELSRVTEVAVVSACKMYEAEYKHLVNAASTSTVQGAAGAAGPAGVTHSSAQKLPEEQQAQTGDGVITVPYRKSAEPPVLSAGGGKSAAVPVSCDAGLASKTPKQLQPMLLGMLMPVQISIARGTWITWKKGALALTPSVPLMLTAVQQLLDALSALGITYKLLATTQQLHPQQAHTAPAAPHQTSSNSSTSGRGGGSSSSSSGGGGLVASASECVQWQQQLLLHELVEPMHGSFCGLLEALSGLVVLVQEHVRKPTEASKAALHKEIQRVHDMRVSVSLEYINLRNHRHRKMRQQLAALWQQHQQQHHPHQHHQDVLQGQHQAPVAPLGSDTSSSGVGRSSIVSPAADSGAEASRATGSMCPVGPPVGDVGREASIVAAAEDECAGWGIEQPGFEHQVLSTVQYMAFVHALRRFFDRAVAVARCAADASF